MAVFGPHALSDYEQHQENLHQVFEELFQDNSFEDLLPEFYHSYYDNRMRHDETPHIVSFLQESYSEDELHFFSMSMRWCRCCNRHRHYKTVLQPAHVKSNCRCGCPCRRLYRLFKTYDLA